MASPAQDQLTGNSIASQTVDQLDGVSSSLAMKAPCDVATTANIVLAGLQVIDTLQTTEGMSVLVAHQTNPVQNGIWLASTGNWTRRPDFDGSRDVRQGTQVRVNRGASNDNSMYFVETLGPIEIDTTGIVFGSDSTAVSQAVLDARDQAAAYAAAAAASAAAAAASAGVYLPFADQVHALGVKSALDDNDELGLADTSNSYVGKKILWSAFKSAIWLALGALIAGGSNKATLVDADKVGVADSVASNATKYTTALQFWTNYIKVKADVAYQAALGFTAVQQGTGIGQSGNVVKIGWSPGNHLKATVDSSDMGTIYTSVDPPPASGGMTLLSTGTPSNGASSYTVTGLATSYVALLVVAEGVGQSGAPAATMTISSDNGSSFDTALSVTGGGTAYSFAHWLHNVGDTAAKILNGVSGGSATANGTAIAAVFATKTSPTNAIRLNASGTFNGTGTVKIYGVK